MRLLTILCLVLLVSCSQEVVTGPFLIRDGIMYDQDTNELVTGPYESFHDNGQLELRINIIDGKRVGRYRDFHDNGQLRSRGNVIDDELTGPFEEFYSNGQLEFRGNVIDGKVEGLGEFFDQDGNLTGTSTFRNGVVVE